MLNFELYNPTNYIFGKNQIEKLSKLIPEKAKILLAYGGGSIFKNGIYDSVIKNLAGFQVVEFGGIEPNPRFETLMKAVDVIKKENITFILAVGGGSVIDGVKCVAADKNFTPSITLPPPTARINVMFSFLMTSTAFISVDRKSVV